MIRKIRPFFNERTPLENVPRDWLTTIEPKIVRIGQCWHWTGTVINGHPVIFFYDDDGKKTTEVAARIVARMFWEYPPFASVIHACGERTCLNPAHLHITDQHWKHRGKKDD